MLYCSASVWWLMKFGYHLPFVKNVYITDDNISAYMPCNVGIENTSNICINKTMHEHIHRKGAHVIRSKPVWVHNDNRDGMVKDQIFRSPMTFSCDTCYFQSFIMAQCYRYDDTITICLAGYPQNSHSYYTLKHHQSIQWMRARVQWQFSLKLMPIHVIHEL